MKIESVFDKAFALYGRVLEGYDFGNLIQALQKHAPLPQAVSYVPSVPVLENDAVFGALQNNAFGGMPIQIGWCVGHNSKLNCLEYHKSSEINIGTEDFILLVATMSEIEEGKLDTAKVKAFRAPAGVAVELYATTLHYAPCSGSAEQGFKVAVVLPKGTNGIRSDGAKPPIEPLNAEDALLWRTNKWLLAHAESKEAAAGAQICLQGENIHIG